MPVMCAILVENNRKGTSMRYIRVEQEIYYDEVDAAVSEGMGLLKVFVPHLWASEVIREVSNPILATFENSGRLIYPTTKEHLAMCHKIPDYKYIGDGKWVKDER